MLYSTPNEAPVRESEEKPPSTSRENGIQSDITPVNDSNPYAALQSASPYVTSETTKTAKLKSGDGESTESVNERSSNGSGISNDDLLLSRPSDSEDGAAQRKRKVKKSKSFLQKQGDKIKAKLSFRKKGGQGKPKVSKKGLFQIFIFKIRSNIRLSCIQCKEGKNERFSTKKPSSDVRILALFPFVCQSTRSSVDPFVRPRVLPSVRFSICLSSSSISPSDHPSTRPSIGLLVNPSNPPFYPRTHPPLPQQIHPIHLSRPPTGLLILSVQPIPSHRSDPILPSIFPSVH